MWHFRHVSLSGTRGGLFSPWQSLQDTPRLPWPSFISCFCWAIPATENMNSEIIPRTAVTTLFVFIQDLLAEKIPLFILCAQDVVDGLKNHRGIRAYFLFPTFQNGIDIRQ